ncbi:hypothetical protein GCM10011490_06420 [Pseudoclavibacter endophyticus]|uniref:Uncharacterized protein n=1 Tax=Pseudoclavibacter endophyticus TaxID=1778590 RepID=A0A6H9WP35_9MICO|nr:hypothetical protein [Pseudoclavibacter endophyticus]KAB1649868.1 hypothetical protein F8O04_06465 [Pseudoclavibacter endophyticus]GGA59157.1 hypothetical protein GCM10011490_06420 [Pseudoclavibacter endophyticus]
MTIVLSGGGLARIDPDVDAEDTLGLTGDGIAASIARFVSFARAHAVAAEKSAARIAVVVAGPERRAAQQAAEWRVRLEAVEGDVRAAAAEPEGDPVDGSAAGELALEIRTIVYPRRHREPATEALDVKPLLAIDGLVVGDGVAFDYLCALGGRAVDVRRLVTEGVAYYGHGAGAAIAATKAIVGGTEIGGVPVCPLDADDTGPREIEIEAGLGLVDLTIEVRASGQGTLGRAIAAVESGLVDAAIAIDEDTAVVIKPGDLGMIGTGSLWQIMPGERGVNVGTVRV